MKTKKMLLSAVKLKYNNGTADAERSETLSHLADKYDAKGAMGVHSKTDELLWGLEEYHAAVARGEVEVEVVVWDIPEGLVFGVYLLMNGKNLTKVEASKAAKKAMKYFSFKENGPGAELRRRLDPDDNSLPDFVAKLFGTNRTDLYRLLELGEKKRYDLLTFVDAGVTTPQQALRVANGRKIEAPANDTQTEAAQKGRRPAGASRRNRFTAQEEITRTEQLSAQELRAITAAIPDVLSSLDAQDNIPQEMFVERVYQHIPAADRKEGNTSPKLDHIGVAGEIFGFSFQMTLRPTIDGDTTTPVIQLPVRPSEDEDCLEQLPLAA